jgi:hypothetical protein
LVVKNLIEYLKNYNFVYPNFDFGVNTFLGRIFNSLILSNINLADIFQKLLSFTINKFISNYEIFSVITTVFYVVAAYSLHNNISPSLLTLIDVFDKFKEILFLPISYLEFYVLLKTDHFFDNILKDFVSNLKDFMKTPLDTLKGLDPYEYEKGLSE